ncbi:MAG: aminotransferase class V-fold PLP-dependent enzyme, partial [Flavobacteriaceae bacterium]|nr:aminotransferase class V-fold PLP-dependent enzyme [Flavobacteriaceae bacterium]
AKNITYLNGAFMSPLLKSVEKIGHKSISKKCMPYEITANDFFDNTTKLKQVYAKLIDLSDYQDLAIIPSVSYGIATVANNVNLFAGDEILVVGDQFPSNFYSWEKLAKKIGAIVKIITAPEAYKNRGGLWNEKILDAIGNKTSIVAMPHVHWADGTLFDLKAIRKKTKQNEALLIIDGTQSVGALPFSVNEIQPDALICAGYKWLLGPYSIGLAYYSDRFREGNPIEENWINRKNSQNFSGLVSYEEAYQPKAGRFNVGEMSNFTLSPMLIKSIEQLLLWKPQNIQDYCKKISENYLKELQNLGCFIEDANYRAHHLFGIYLPEGINLNLLKAEFEKNKIYVSFRGSAIRVSPNVYNLEDDFKKLVHCFKNIL